MFILAMQAGEWKTCILEVDFFSHLFRLQHSDRVVNVLARTTIDFIY